MAASTISPTTELQQQDLVKKTPSRPGDRKVIHWLCELAEGTDKIVAVKPYNDDDVSDLSRLRVIMLAPKGSPGIEDYILYLNVDNLDSLPQKPPRITFESAIWHPRIRLQTGEICLNILWPEYWKPYFNLEIVLVAIQSVLSDPIDMSRDDMKGVFNESALNQYFDDRPSYIQSAKQKIEESAHGGYGKLKFEDLRISCIQAFLKIPAARQRAVKYECSVYCQKNGESLWKLMFVVVPKLALYQQRKLKQRYRN